MQDRQFSLFDKNATSRLNSEEEILRGTLERITYSNSENGYSILKFKLEKKIAGKDEVVVAVGTMPNPTVGGFFVLTGKWTQHPKFGEQFKFESFEEERPETLDGIRMFLASGVIKGMGKTLASRVVDHFGADTFNILDNEPERLLEVPRVTKKTVTSVKESWKEQQDIRELMVFLNPHGIGTAHAVKVYKYYGHSALDIVKDNPYRMAMDIHGIGFETADRFALSIGFEQNSILRAQAHRKRRACLFSKR